MIDAIKNNAELFSICRSECHDNNVDIEIDTMIDKDNNLCILDVDDYYKSFNISNRPKSIDCLIVQKCNKDNYELYLIELKNIKRLKNLSINDTVKKFRITINHFMKEKFKSIFLNTNYKFKKPLLYLVVKFKNIKTIEGHIKKHIGTRFETFQNIKPFEFRGDLCKIQPLPPNLTIKKC